MSDSPNGQSNKQWVMRIFGAMGFIWFLSLAFVIGSESLHARSTGSRMSNFKGGTMDYQDGFKLVAVCLVFAAFFCYGAVRKKGKN